MLFASSPNFHIWLWRLLTDLVTEYLLDTDPSVLFPVSWSQCLFSVFRFFTLNYLFFLKNYLWDIFEVYDENNFLGPSLVFVSAGGTTWLVNDMVLWWQSSFRRMWLCDLGWKPKGGFSCGDSSSGTGFSLCCLCLMPRQLFWEGAWS